MKHVVMFSGGAGSWAAAVRVAREHGTQDLDLLFTDTGIEDEDLYRFIEEAAVNVGGTLHVIRQGQTPWEVFRSTRFLGNTRVSNCSRILKQEPARKWLEDNHEPQDTTVYLGIDWSEVHRFTRARALWTPWSIEAPMCDAPYLSKADVLTQLRDAGVCPPRLYTMGFPHNNCGGFCVRAGQAHFRHLWEMMPDRYLQHEDEEEGLRAYLKKDVSILRDRVGGPVRPMTLREFRHRIQAKSTQVDLFEWGGCGCFLEDETTPASSESSPTTT